MLDRPIRADSLTDTPLVPRSRSGLHTHTLTLIHTICTHETPQHPEHHIETGVEYHCDYVGSARIGNTIAPNAETQDAVLITARKVGRTTKISPLHLAKH